MGMPGILVVRINIPRMHWNSSCLALRKEFSWLKGFVFPLLRNLCSKLELVKMLGTSHGPKGCYAFQVTVP